MALDNEENVRYEALHVLKLIWTQGHTNPIEIIPTLAALLSDVSTYIRELASVVLTQMFNRRPDLLVLRFTDGVKASFKFQIDNRHEASAHTTNIHDSDSTEPIFGKL